MHQKSFVGRAQPGPAEGAYSAPPVPLAGFKRPTSKEGKRKWWEGEGKEGEWRGGKGRRSGLPPTHNFWLRHCRSAQQNICNYDKRRLQG